MIRFLTACALLACLLFAGCRATKPDPESPQRPLTTADLPRPAADAGPDSVGSQLPTQGPKLPTQAKPGILSGIGSLFSTPEGTAHRQAVRLAKASVPRKLGKAAVYAPLAAKVVNGGYKSEGPTTNADAGATVNVTDIDKNKAPAATAPNATATEVTTEAPGPLATIAAKLTGPLGWALGLVALGAVGYGVYRLWPILKRRKADNQA